jgi:hypothetical protein
MKGDVEMDYQEALQTVLRMFQPLAILSMPRETCIRMGHAKARHLDAWIRHEMETGFGKAKRTRELGHYSEFYTFIRPHMTDPEETLRDVALRLGWVETEEHRRPVWEKALR